MATNKSGIYAANGMLQVLGIGDTINFGNVVRKYGCGINMSGGNVVTHNKGYYNIATNITITPSAAGTLGITLYKNGVEIPGANITRTVSADTIYAFDIVAMIRDICCCETTIAAVISGVASTVSNAAIEVFSL